MTARRIPSRLIVGCDECGTAEYEVPEGESDDFIHEGWTQMTLYRHGWPSWRRMHLCPACTGDVLGGLASPAGD